MAAEIGPLGVSALALLAERPMHPYEMYQLLVQRVEDRIVKVRPGSLYHTVDRLATSGLVRATGTEREGNRPERTTYEITEAGQLALAERVAQLLETPVNEFPTFPVAISQAHNLPKGMVLELLRRRLGKLQAELEGTERNVVAVSGKSLPRRYWLDVSYLRSQLDAEVTWLTALIDDLDSGRLDWDEKKHPEEPPRIAQPQGKQ